MTIKAKRALENVSVVSFTQLDDGKESFALNVAREVPGLQPTLIAITIPSDDETPVESKTRTDAQRISLDIFVRAPMWPYNRGRSMLYSECLLVLER
ncbi:MAG: hypothetical protein CM1200mP22_32200 [Dehalococcoidia bacterium]|nr:MAG: hypothetical protein CM1200mP22_32200 [Dehalococcoidia bacterium]